MTGLLDVARGLTCSLPNYYRQDVRLNAFCAILLREIKYRLLQASHLKQNADAVNYAQLAWARANRVISETSEDRIQSITSPDRKIKVLFFCQCKFRMIAIRLPLAGAPDSHTDNGKKK
jgi:hypothetical protein